MHDCWICLRSWSENPCDDRSMKELTITITAEEIQAAFRYFGKDVTMAQAEVLLDEYAQIDCPILGGIPEDKVWESVNHFAKTEDLSEYVWDDPSASGVQTSCTPSQP